MPSKTHVANKRLSNRVIWGLESILAACLSSRRALDSAMDRAEQRMDTETLLELCQVDRELSFIQRKARDARAGVYNEE